MTRPQFYQIFCVVYLVTIPNQRQPWHRVYLVWHRMTSVGPTSAQRSKLLVTTKHR